MIHTAMVTPLNAVKATTTSAAFDVAGAHRVTFVFTRADHAQGNTVFTILASVDGVTYLAYNKLITNIANSNAETLTRVASVTHGENATAIVSMDFTADTFHSLKAVATQTTDGTHTVQAFITYK